MRDDDFHRLQAWRQAQLRRDALMGSIMLATAAILGALAAFLLL